MQIAWSGLSQCYEFDTGEIMGGIQPFTNYHGICGLMHRDYRVGVVRYNKAFLNAEYYLRPGSGMVMYPRRLSLAREVAHERNRISGWRWTSTIDRSEMRWT